MGVKHQASLGSPKWCRSGPAAEIVFSTLDSGFDGAGLDSRSKLNVWEMARRGRSGPSNARLRAAGAHPLSLQLTLGANKLLDNLSILLLKDKT